MQDSEIREFEQMLAICADSMPVETTAGNLRAWRDYLLNRNTNRSEEMVVIPDEDGAL